MASDRDKRCFVICPLGNAGSDTRRRSDQVVKHIICKAVGPLGYDVSTAIQIAQPGLITRQVIQRVLDDDLVVADLTDWNPNVFYELAIRHAVRKPLVQLIASGEDLPFDIANMRTIKFDHQDLDSADQACTELAKQVKHLEKNPGDLDTPVSEAIDLQDLQRSGDPEDRSMAEILRGVSDLRQQVSLLTRQVESGHAPRRHPRSRFAFDGEESEMMISMARLNSLKESQEELRHALQALPSNAPRNQRKAMEEKLMDVQHELRSFEAEIETLRHR